MSVRRQAAEWRNVVPQGVTVVKPQHPILGRWTTADEVAGRTYEETIVGAQVVANIPVDMFNGGIGNNLATTAQLTATQLIVLDSLACWPLDASINIHIDDTYYFEAPDYSSIKGLSGYMVPFPEPNALNIFTHEVFQHGIDPPIYIFPGQTWGVYISLEQTAGGSSPTADDQLVRCFVKYLLIDGSDFLISQKMLELGIPVTWSNIQKFRQDLTRFQLMADIGEGDLDEELIRETGVTTRRRPVP